MTTKYKEFVIIQHKNGNFSFVLDASRAELFK